MSEPEAERRVLTEKDAEDMRAMLRSLYSVGGGPTRSRSLSRMTGLEPMHGWAMLEESVKCGYAVRDRAGAHVRYKLTEDGKSWLGESA